MQIIISHKNNQLISIRFVSGLSGRPAWFEAAITHPFEDYEVPGIRNPNLCAIHYQLYKPSAINKASNKRPQGVVLVLVHGGGAHSRWWDWIAPFLASDGHPILVAAGPGLSADSGLPVYIAIIFLVEI